MPAPSWVRTEKVTIPEEVIDEAATILNKHFETDDVIRDIGGKKWWTVRGRPLTGEFVEMAKDRLVRERAEEEARAEGKEPEASRVLLYIHGVSCFCIVLLGDKVTTNLHRWSIVSVIFPLQDPS